jgi:hypothetical protein
MLTAILAIPTVGYLSAWLASFFFVIFLNSKWSKCLCGKHILTSSPNMPVSLSGLSLGKPSDKLDVIPI